MSNHYNERFAKIVEAVNSDAMKEYAHIDHPNGFIGERKMPIEDIVLCTLSKKGLTTTMEIHIYFKAGIFTAA